MDKDQKVVVKARAERVRQLLAKVNLYVNEGDDVKAFEAAEEAYGAAFDLKDCIDRIAFPALAVIDAQLAKA